MIGLFKQKSPVNVIMLLVLGLLIKAPLFLYAKPIQIAATDGIFYTKVIVPFFQHSRPFTACTASFILIYIQALFINYVANEYRLTSRQTYLPAMAYILITSLLPEWNYLSAPLIANTLIILCLVLLFKLYNATFGKETIYNMGLILGLCTFIFFPSLFVTLCLLIGIMILRPFRLNELLLLITGVLTPFYFYAVYLFLKDNLSFSMLFTGMKVQVPEIINTIWLSVSVVILTLLFFIGGYQVQFHFRKMLIQVRKNWSILLIYLLLTMGIPFVNTSSSFHNWVLMAVPFAFFHAAAYFYISRKWLSLSLFFITIAVILVQQYATTLWH